MFRNLVFAGALALMALPAQAQSENGMQTVRVALAKTPCKDLTRIVMGDGPQTETEHALQTAAMGILMGRVLSRSPTSDTLMLLFNIEIGLFGTECSLAPEQPWLVGIMALQKD